MEELPPILKRFVKIYILVDAERVKALLHPSTVMSEPLKIALTAAATLIGGIILFGMQKFFLEPIYEYTKSVARIAFLLHYHAEVYANPHAMSASATNQQWQEFWDSMKGKRYSSAKDDLRKAASDLSSAAVSIQAYVAFERLKLVPRKKDVREVIGILTGISNGLTTHGIDVYRDAIRNSDESNRARCLVGIGSIIPK